MIRRYLSHLRLGAAAFVEAEDTPAAPSRFATAASMTVNAAPVSVPVTLFGPGDVAGLALSAIAARTPAPGSVGAEVNFFPHVEIAEADLPWRFTPARADATGRLRPWLVLVVLERREGVGVTPVSGTQLRAVEAPIAELPDLDEADLWAHVQVTLPDGFSGPLEDFVRTSPRAAVARLTAPRRMAPNTGYLACLVPGFEVGRLAGLGDDPGADATLTPAWSFAPGSSARVRLPVYDHWSFTTGGAADFESLARALTPHQIPPEAASPPFVVDPMLAQTTVTMGLMGALEPARRVAPPEPVPTEVADALVARINRAADLAEETDTPQVGSPLYGRWQAGFRHLRRAGTPAWLDELNTDPRLRIAAAAGGDVVQRHQEAFVAEAWRQVGQLRAANALLRGAQAARGVGGRLADRHLQRMPDDLLLQVAGPALARLPTGAEATMFETVAASALPEAGFEGAFRRITRARGPHLRRFGVSDARAGSGVFFKQGLERWDITGWSAVDQGTVSAPSNWRTLGFSFITQKSNIHRPVTSTSDISYLGTMFTTGEASWRDVRFSMKIDAIDNDSFGAVFRYRGPTNYYRFQADRERRFMRLVKCVNGLFTSLWERTDAPLTGEHELRILVEGDRIRVFFGLPHVGQPLVADVRDTSHATGKVGLYCWGMDDVRFKDIKIEIQTGLHDAHLAAATVDQGNISTPSRWSVEEGEIRQRANIYREPQDRDHLPKLGTYLRIGSTFWTDYRFESLLRMQEDNDAIGLMFRVRDPDNYYRFSMDRQRSYRRLVRCENGVFTLLWQEDIGYAESLFARVALVADGSRLRGYLAGKKLFDLRDRAHMRGQVALYCWGAVGAGFGDVSVRGIGTMGIVSRLNANHFLHHPVPPGSSLNMATMKADMLTALDPHHSVKAKVLDRTRVPARRTSEDPLEEERPAVRLPQPLAPRLAAQAPELLLPGVTGVPDNAVVMLATNPAFVAAFLVGANHEMARELIWRGLPADLRATVFPQFWDVRESGAAAPDIDDIHAWRPERPLPEQVTSRRPRSVFLVRSELVRRFPTLAVYLVQAVASDGGRRPGTMVEPPQFGGRLADDMAYYGFPRAPAEVIGTDDRLGWYVVIEQRSAALRFGLDLEGPDTLAAWSDLAWSHIAPGPYLHSTALGPAPPPGPQWARNAAHMAAITQQQPVRLFIHAERLVTEA